MIRWLLVCLAAVVCAGCANTVTTVTPINTTGHGWTLAGLEGSIPAATASSLQG